MVDYRKWDSFVADLSDSDNEENGPKVTKLSGSKGGTVRIGPQGAEIVQTRLPSSSASTSVSQNLPSKLVTDRAEDILLKCTINGHHEPGYFWSQDRNEVTVWIKIDGNAKAKDVVVRLVDGNHLLITWQAFAFDGVLQYDVVSEGSREETIDWEFAPEIYEGQRLVQITFVKKSLIAGATMWWKNTFRGGHEIDLTLIQGRDQRHVINSTLWQDAHALFANRVKEMVPLTVDTEGEEEVDPEGK